MKDGRETGSLEEDRNGEPYALKGARTVCAVRRFETFLSQTGGTREMFLSYQLTWRRKPKGTRACLGKRCMLESVVKHGIRMARLLWVKLHCLNPNPTGEYAHSSERTLVNDVPRCTGMNRGLIHSLCGKKDQ